MRSEGGLRGGRAGLARDLPHKRSKFSKSLAPSRRDRPPCPAVRGERNRSGVERERRSSPAACPPAISAAHRARSSSGRPASGLVAAAALPPTTSHGERGLAGDARPGRRPAGRRAGHSHGNRADHVTSRRCQPRNSHPPAAQRGRPGDRCGLAAVSHCARPGSIQRRHGDTGRNARSRPRAGCLRWLRPAGLPAGPARVRRPIDGCPPAVSGCRPTPTC